MQKLFEKPERCDDCKNVLDDLFIKCLSCNTSICYDCLPNHPRKHRHLPCRIVDGNKAEVINVGQSGFGPNIPAWPSYDFDLGFISSHLLKCEHANEFVEKNNFIFNCMKCRKYLCLECSKEHLDHGLILEIKDKDKMLQMIPPIFETDKELKIEADITFRNNNILGQLELINDNNDALFDLSICYSWDGFSGSGYAIHELNNKWYNLDLLKEIEIIPANEKYKIEFQIGLNDRIDSLIIIIYYKDVFLSRGTVIHEFSVD